jgi:hypothetical protein
MLKLFQLYLLGLPNTLGPLGYIALHSIVEEKIFGQETVGRTQHRKKRTAEHFAAAAVAAAVPIIAASSAVAGAVGGAGGVAVGAATVGVGGVLLKKGLIGKALLLTKKGPLINHALRLKKALLFKIAFAPFLLIKKALVLKKLKALAIVDEVAAVAAIVLTATAG